MGWITFRGGVLIYGGIGAVQPRHGGGDGGDGDGAGEVPCLNHVALDPEHRACFASMRLVLSHEHERLFCDLQISAQIRAMREL